MNVRIVVDSTADVPERVKKKLTLVPLCVRFGDEEFIDGVTINHRRFYEKLIEGDVMPATSQPTPAAFEKVYREAEAAGEQTVVITVSKKLSGTYQSAVIAAMDMAEEGNVFVVDGETVALGTGILAEYALALAEKGLSAAEIAEKLEIEKKNVRLVALFDTLEYLKRGGRISKTAAIAGGVLSIKPVIAIDDGEVKILGKARGSKQGNNLLAQHIEKYGGVDFERPVLLGYTGLSDELLKKYISDSIALWEGNGDKLDVTCVGSVVGTHAGPGAIAAAFFSKNG